MATDFYGDTINNYWKPKHLPSKSLSYLPPSLQVIILPLVYTAFYFLAMNIPGIMRIGSAFGFFSLAKTQWLNPAVMQLASFTGMYGVTFLILSVNCAIAYGIIHYKETKKAYKPTIVILAIFLVVLVFGFIEVPNNIEKGDVTVAVIQTSPEEGQDINDLYLRLSEESLKYNPKIIVWPFMMMEGLSPPTNFSIDHNVYLVSAEVISPEGTAVSDNLGYHMVTLFENFKDKDIKSVFFPKVYSLNTDLGNFGIANCMESGSALPTRKRVRDGAQVLIVPTGCPNTYVLSWVLGTSAIYRAVEHRMFAVEVIGDHDSSIIIDPYGRIIEDMAPEPEIVVGKISFTDERTFYTKYGDVFGWTITGLYIVLIIYNFYLKKKSPFKYCKYCRTQIAKEVKICPKCGKKTK
jgi:apolipoprotein N-acyltransferase